MKPVLFFLFLLIFSGLPGIDVVSLKKQKAIIDSRLLHDQKSIIAFAKVPHKKELIKVKNNKWPDEVEYSYNILKDSANNIIMILQGPFSESGDWDISYIHYFDKAGKTFAFERRTNFFNSECTEGAAYEVVSNYYQDNFTKVDQTYKLTNKQGKSLAKSKCNFPYDFKYTIYKNVSECLKAYHINLE